MRATIAWLSPAIAMIGMMALVTLTPAGAGELNQRDHPDPATAARLAHERAAIARLKKDLRRKDGVIVACIGSDGTAVVIGRDGSVLRNAFGEPVVVRGCD